MAKTCSERLVPLARLLRKRRAPAEGKLWFEGLRHLPQRFRRQRPFGDTIVDFYCAEAKLVIELDGQSHASDEAAAADFFRDEYLKALGLEILRFSNAEVMQNLAGVVERIRMAIAARTPLSP